MSEYFVYKYGGTSAAQPEVVAEGFCANPETNRVAVMSAIGKDITNPNDRFKGTEWLELLEGAVDARYPKGIAEAQEAFIEKNRHAYRMLDNTVLMAILDDTYKDLNVDRRSYGYKWIGERVSARLFASLIDGIYVPSELKFQKGAMLARRSIRDIGLSLAPLLKSNRQIVTEGFIGTDIESGKIVTLPYGGSDISAVIYTAALNNDKDHWININSTDKDGVLDADPSIIPKAQVISEMTYEEIREKMHGITERNGVIHGDAIAYASTLDVEIYVRNTFNHSVAGTHIVQSRTSNPDKPVIGISGKSDISAIDVFDMGMADASGYFGDVLSKVGEVGASVATIPKSEDRLKLVFNGGDSRKNLEQIRAHILRHAISGKKAKVEILRNQGTVYLIGQELRNPRTYTRILGIVANLLADEGLAIREVTSHEKSPSLAMTVDGEKVQHIIRLLHGKLVQQQM
jgi:aspartate kinase